MYQLLLIFSLLLIIVCLFAVIKIINNYINYYFGNKAYIKTYVRLLMYLLLMWLSIILFKDYIVFLYRMTLSNFLISLISVIFSPLLLIIVNKIINSLYDDSEKTKEFDISIENNPAPAYKPLDQYPDYEEVKKAVIKNNDDSVKFLMDYFKIGKVKATEISKSLKNDKVLENGSK